ncbi:MAG: hypothetical protein R3E65_00215 [Steroidobacteraceae bacterium]
MNGLAATGDADGQGHKGTDCKLAAQRRRTLDYGRRVAAGTQRLRGGGGDSAPPPPPPPPPPTTYTLGGTVSRLAGSELVLQNNGGSNLTVSANGSFSFAGSVNAGTAYSVTVQTQPSNPTQTCTVANGSGTANANVTNISVTCTTVTAAADTDGDGLTDEQELNVYGTNPAVADTDGDGYSDRLEVIDFGFDATTNPYRYNPLVADLPQIEVRINQNPIIGWDFSQGQNQTDVVQTSRAQTTSQSTSVGYGTSTTIGVEATTSATVGGSLLDGPSAEVTQSVSLSASSTVSFDTTLTRENQQTWESMQSRGVEQSTTTSGGFVQVGVRIRNTGHIPFTLRQISLSSTQASEASTFVPFAALDYDSQQSFQPTVSRVPEHQRPGVPEREARRRHRPDDADSRAVDQDRTRDLRTHRRQRPAVRVPGSDRCLAHGQDPDRLWAVRTVGAARRRDQCHAGQPGPFASHDPDADAARAPRGRRARAHVRALRDEHDRALGDRQQAQHRHRLRHDHLRPGCPAVFDRFDRRARRR